MPVQVYKKKVKEALPPTLLHMLRGEDGLPCAKMTGSARRGGVESGGGDGGRRGRSEGKKGRGVRGGNGVGGGGEGCGRSERVG